VDRKHQGREIRARIRTRATPEQVWEAWTDPEKIAHWFVDRASGQPVVGSIFTWVFEKFGYEIPYEVVASEPNRRFALGGEVPGRGPFLLEVTIERDGGETVVTLVNSGFLDGGEWDEEYEGVRSGWANALAVLKHYLENYFGRPKRQLLVMQPADYEYPSLLSHFATPEGLCGWLATTASIGGEGDSCALRLPDGESVTGTVLSKTKWEVVFSWEERDAVLELKGFRFGPSGRVVAVRVLSWGKLIPPNLEARLQNALGVLAERLSARAGAAR
jgi:uncharacterized protein YndB with AHSA1/START domain